MGWTDGKDEDEDLAVYWFTAGADTRPEPEIPEGKNIRQIDRAKPRSHYCHYSNPESQGALICETKGFPDYFDNDTEEFHSAYSDRMRGWDVDNYNNLCDEFGYEQVWNSKLPMLGDERLKEFAKLGLKLEELPAHVRVVHYFNVSNGYSCPVVIAICAKEETETA